MEEAEEQIGDLEDKIIENNDGEQKKRERVMEHKNRLRELSDPIKYSNICIIGVPEEEERGKGAEYLFLPLNLGEGNRHPDPGNREFPSKSTKAGQDIL